MGQYEARRWTLYDTSEDFNPRWKIGDGTPPPANEYAEAVVVMPVAEHEALRRYVEKLHAAVEAAHYMGPSMVKEGGQELRLKELMEMLPEEVTDV